MAAEKRLEIHCPACGNDTLLVREPVYKGFTRVGESLRCASCGHTFASEAEAPFRQGRRVQVFSEADRPAAVELFEEGEAERLCRRCRHYVVNPFMQWCAVHKKEVEATDTCERFERKKEPPPDEEDGAPSDRPLR